MKIKTFLSMIKAIKQGMTEYPDGCKTGNELDWMLKDCCPCCITNPIERTSDYEYERKYPITHILEFGDVKVHLCEYHYNLLVKKIIENQK